MHLDDISSKHSREMLQEMLFWNRKHLDDSLNVPAYYIQTCEILSSHGGEYEAQNLLRCTACS
jgi:hypothetical protein